MVARAPYALTPYLLLARILLCITFVPVGVQKLKTVEFHGEDATRIQRLLEPASAEPKVTDPTSKPTSNVQLIDNQANGSSIKAKALYQTALAVEDAGWGSPVLFAWIAVLTELLGGILLLLGLLSRLWGLGLCVVMGAAFTISTLPLIAGSPWAVFDLPIGEYNRYAAQVGLFGLAMAILVCGPGRISIDQLLFGRNSAATESSYGENMEDDEA
jgi:uncharacterized membrane protein YphA (DoxX/SURF4 family)